MLINVARVENLPLASPHLPIEQVDPLGIEAYIRSQVVYPILKRVLDITIVLLSLPAVLPVLLLAMIAIRFSDGSPALFTQSRVGLNGRSFTLIKLRTMRVSVDSRLHATMTNDDRITPLGRFLRISHVDELPQLWNVLCGHMSLIGPRPEQTRFVEIYRGLIPHYDLRHLVRPGLSGWSQVFFGYAATADETRLKLEFDLFYLRNYGLKTDLVVLARTLLVYLNPRYAR